MAKDRGRPRHVPERTCVACRTHDAKRGLIRLVRTPEGLVEVDPTGRRPGRGAYLCPKRACWEEALKRRALNRALRVVLTPHEVDQLRAYALTLPAAGEEPGAPSLAASSSDMADQEPR